MAAPEGKLTDFPEILAYVLAHAAGLAWAFAVNPMIFRELVAQGRQNHLQLVVIALTIAASVVVLLMFLLLRTAMTKATAIPPPAGLPAPPASLTDLREVSTYLVAHAIGIAWGVAVNPLIFRSLIAQGHRNLAAPAIAISIAVSFVVLMIFLFLRRAMARPQNPT